MYLFLPFAEGYTSPRELSHRFLNQHVVPKEREMSGEGMQMEKGFWDSWAVLLPLKKVSVLVGDLHVLVFKLRWGFVPQVVSREGVKVDVGLTEQLVAVAGKCIWGGQGGSVSDKMALAQSI